MGLAQAGSLRLAHNYNYWCALHLNVLYHTLCRHAWVDQKHRYIGTISAIYICAKQVLYQLPVKTSDENSCIAKQFAVVAIE